MKTDSSSAARKKLNIVFLWIIAGVSAQPIAHDSTSHEVRPCFPQQPCDNTQLRNWQPERKPQTETRRYNRPRNDPLGLAILSHARARGCFPNILREPARSNILKNLGTYYEYRYLPESTTNPVQIYNAEFTYSFIPKGTVLLPDSLIHALHCVRNYNAITLTEAGYPQCFSEDSVILSTPAGVDYHMTFDNNHAAPENRVWYRLYDDPNPNGLEILYACIEPNHLTGFCRRPQLVVNTINHPGSMSYNEKRKIDKLINRVLLPFCMSSHDLLPVIFRPEYPTCDAPPDPAFVKLVRGLTRSLHRRQPTIHERVPGSSHSFTTSGSVSLTRRPNELPRFSQPRRPYSSVDHPPPREYSPQYNGSLQGLRKVPNVLHLSNDHRTSSRNNALSSDYRVVYHSPEEYDRSFPNNRTFRGFEKIPSPFYPPNKQQENHPNNRTQPVLQTESNPIYPTADLEAFFRENRTLPGLTKLPESEGSPENSRYGDRVNKTLHGLDKVSDPPVSAYNRKGNETLNGSSKAPEQYSPEKLEASVDRLGDSSTLPGLSEVDSTAPHLSNTHDFIGFEPDD